MSILFEQLYKPIIKQMIDDDHPTIRLRPTIASLDEGAVMKMVNPLIKAVKKRRHPLHCSLSAARW
ncbi:MAG: hypothetical protein AAF709_19805 [Pseudomonadota bacterium]